jgi:TolB-like protein
VAPAESISRTTGRKLDRIIIVVLALAVVFLVIDDYVLDDPATRVTGSAARTGVDAAVRDDSAETLAPTDVAAADTAVAPLQDSVAVLPFANLSPDEENAFFAIGLHDEVLNQLSKLSNLSVISRTSMLRYVDSDLSVPEIARELNVETVMEGTVRYAGNRIRVTMQLIDAATDQHIWSETYERPFDDIFAIESDIAMNVANALNAEFSSEEQAAIEQIPTESPVAYSLLLQARATIFNGGSYDDAIEVLDRALAIDPGFADGFGTAAAFRASLFTNTAQGTGVAAENRDALEREIRDLAARALELDPNNAIAQTALRVINIPTWRWSAFEDALTRGEEMSLEGIPGLAATQQWVFAWMGRTQEAVDIGRRNVRLNPNDGGSHLSLGISQAYNGERRVAEQTLRHAAQLLPSFPLIHSWIGYNHLALGEEAEAIEALQLTEDLLGSNRQLAYLPELAYGYALLGRQTDVERLFDEMQAAEQQNYIGAGGWAMAYLAIGDEARALEQLEIVAEKARNHVPDEGYLAALNLRMNFLDDPRLEQPAFSDVLSRIRGD